MTKRSPRRPLSFSGHADHGRAAPSRSAQLRPPARAQAQCAPGGAARAACCRDVVLNLADPAPAALGKLFAVPRARGVAGDRLRRRRASALAGRAESRRRPDRLRAVRGRRRQGAARHRGGQESPTSGCMPTMPAPCCAGCPRPASPARSSCFPTPGRRSATTSGGWYRPALLRELARVMRAGAELRIATDIGDYARWMLLAVLEEGSFAWEPRGPSDWRQRARRLAADPLRAEGPERGPPLLPISACVGDSPAEPIVNAARARSAYRVGKTGHRTSKIACQAGILCIISKRS